MGLQIFGFEKVEAPRFEFDVIWLKLAPSFYLHLIERDPTTKLPEGPWSATSAIADPKNLPRGHHVCFTISNFDSFVQKLKVDFNPLPVSLESFMWLIFFGGV